MKIWAKFLFLFLAVLTPLGLLVSCGPGVEYSSLNQTGVEKPPDCPLNIFMPGDMLPPDYNRIGMIDIGENMTGTSMSCGKKTVIEELKKRACAEGADAVQIYQIKQPGLASTCYRMSAYFLSYSPEIKHASVVQTTSQKSSPEKSSVITNTKQSGPDIHFDEFTISPERVKAGGKLQLTVRYTASDKAKGENEPLHITFNYEFFKDGESVFKTKPKSIKSPNNQSIFAIENYSIKAKKRGEYLIRIYLFYENSDGKMLVGKMSQKTLVIE